MLGILFGVLENGWDMLDDCSGTVEASIGLYAVYMCAVCWLVLAVQMHASVCYMVTTTEPQKSCNCQQRLMVLTARTTSSAACQAVS